VITLRTTVGSRGTWALGLVLLVACGGDEARTATPSELDMVDRALPSPLRVQFLGVGGFLLEQGGETIMTPPLYTRPSMFDVTFGRPVASDERLVAKHLPDAMLSGVKTVLSGHAHYDHLLDLPAVLARAPQATFYGNRSAKNLLAAYAPDRAPSCSGTAAPSTKIERARVVALDDPSASVIDYTNCPSLRPTGAPLQGTWVRPPGSRVRIYAVCSEHPDQFGPIHFGAGDVDEEPCKPPTKMDEWKEGATLAFVVDFLDAATDQPVYRVYYQDAPAEAPLGFVPPRVLEEKRVDVAILCVGAYQNADGNPGSVIRALDPRFVIGGHWEDFFRSADKPPQPIPFTDVDKWLKEARAAVGPAPTERAVLPKPGDPIEIVAEP
jgi:L-ascorbate metabolism protein UlaG (beta-lactamase superfamily)